MSDSNSTHTPSPSDDDTDNLFPDEIEAYRIMGTDSRAGSPGLISILGLAYQHYELDRSRVRRLLQTHFNLDEFKTLCFDLDVNYDTLPGDNLNAKIRELTLLMERKGKIPDLIACVIQERPNLSFNRFFKHEENITLDPGFFEPPL